MHPVVGHLLQRKHKQVPIDDGRNIALVNFGGFMNGAYSAGAMLALVEMGLGHSFDSMYTISSGFHNACSFLSGDGKRNTSVYYEDLCDGHFFEPKRFWKIMDVEYLVHILTRNKPIHVEKIYEQKTELFVRLKNKQRGAEEYVEVHDIPKDRFWDLIRAAASVPFLSPGYISLNPENAYKDPMWFNGQILSHITHVLQTPATDITIFYNQYATYEYANKHIPNLMSDRVLQIYPDQHSTVSRFENRPAVLKQVIRQMGKKVNSLFGIAGEISIFESEKESLQI